MAGSVLMLIAILGLAYLHNSTAGAYSFDLRKLYELRVPPALQFWFFLAFALAFAIKVPLFPFHTWLPDAHVEAPTAGSVILAGVLLKMGTYGLVRFAFPLFPDAASFFAPGLATLAVIGFVGEFLILLGAFKWDARYAAFAATGVILSATYMLWMFQRVNYGPVTNEKNAALPDLVPREWVVLVPIVAMTVVMGVVPNLFLRPMEPSVNRMLSQVRQHSG